MVGGSETHSISVSELPPHNHTNGTFNRLMQVTGYNTSNGQVDNTGSEPDLYNTAIEATVGNGQAMNLMNPYMPLKYIIKY
jgi:microcystin-dependent protein